MLKWTPILANSLPQAALKSVYNLFKGLTVFLQGQQRAMGLDLNDTTLENIDFPNGMELKYT